MALILSAMKFDNVSGDKSLDNVMKTETDFKPIKWRQMKRLEHLILNLILVCKKWLKISFNSCRLL